MRSMKIACSSPSNFNHTTCPLVCILKLISQLRTRSGHSCNLFVLSRPPLIQSWRHTRGLRVALNPRLSLDDVSSHHLRLFELQRTPSLPGTTYGPTTARMAVYGTNCSVWVFRFSSRVLFDFLLVRWWVRCLDSSIPLATDTRHPHRRIIFFSTLRKVPPDSSDRWMAIWIEMMGSREKMQLQWYHQVTRRSVMCVDVQP